MDWIEPTDAFARLQGRRGVCWIDSSLSRAHDGRFSVMACEPTWLFTARDGGWACHVYDDQGNVVRRERGESGALQRLDTLLDEGRTVPAREAGELPFVGGAIGWLAYDLGRCFERIDAQAIDDLQAPDVAFGWYDAALVWDHVRHEAAFVALRDESLERLAQAMAVPIPERPGLAANGVAQTVSSNLSRDEYRARVETARQAIADAEFYQINLVQRFTCALQESPAAIYRRLRTLNPAPFAAYLEFDDWAVLSSSPERFLEINPEGKVRTCPIKGTRPRGGDADQDRARRQELLASPKERAELLMIVDLLRNDLGRVCEIGSIEVPRLHALESFATVHHLVGEVTGQLRRGLKVSDLLRAVFPGGSITGAPKISAMRAIERMEPHRRGIGMGSIGYLSAHGRTDLNIAIRTIVCRHGHAYVPVGAGIVWDSEPEAEYAETLAKARALFEALGVSVKA